MLLVLDSQMLSFLLACQHNHGNKIMLIIIRKKIFLFVSNFKALSTDLKQFEYVNGNIIYHFIYQKTDKSTILFPIYTT